MRQPVKVRRVQCFRKGVCAEVVVCGSEIDQDAEDLRMLAAGDEAAARRLMQRHLAAVHGLASRLINDRSEAEDIAQEAFLRVWKHAGKWQDKGAKFSTWLHRVVVNLCIDRMRKQIAVPTDTSTEQVDDNLLVDHELIRDEAARTVRTAIDALPERQKTALILFHYQGLSQVETAQVLEISVEAVESLLSRARRGLKAALTSRKQELIGAI